MATIHEIPSMGSHVCHKFCEGWTPESPCPPGWWALRWRAWPGQWWRTRPPPPPWCRPTGSEGRHTDLIIMNYENSLKIQPTLHSNPGPSAPRMSRWTQSRISPGCRTNISSSTWMESRTPNSEFHWKNIEANQNKTIKYILLYWVWHLGRI